MNVVLDLTMSGMERCVRLCVRAGCVAIQVASKDTVKVVRTLDAGQAFGELALLTTRGRRAASVLTSMSSEFLTIDGKQYQQLLAHLQKEELRCKVDVLRRAPMFRCLPDTCMHQLVLPVKYA